MLMDKSNRHEKRQLKFHKLPKMSSMSSFGRDGSLSLTFRLFVSGRWTLRSSVVSVPATVKAFPGIVFWMGEALIIFETTSSEREKVLAWSLSRVTALGGMRSPRSSTFPEEFSRRMLLSVPPEEESWSKLAIAVIKCWCSSDRVCCLREVVIHSEYLGLKTAIR